MSFRNRCVIAGANGPINLTVPIVGGRDQKSFAHIVRIDNSVSWQKQHLKSVISAYRRAPFFEHYADGFSALFARKYENLFEWNLQCMNWLRDAIGSDWSFSLSDNYQQFVDGQMIIDLRNCFSPRSLKTMKPAFLPYRQVFQERNGFCFTVSVIDFLFCAGPRAIREAGRKVDMTR